MAKDLLFEIGMEEVPARFLRGTAEQLQQKITKWLTDARVSFASADIYATPRRIAVKVNDVAEQQADVKEEAKGPSKKIALDEEGNWSKAALGFARSQQVEPSDLYFKDLGGVEYVYATKNSIGVATMSLFEDGLRTIIQSMTFPKNMHWGSYEMKFVRPIRWLVALFGSDVIPLKIANVKAGRTTRGHRFLGGELELAKPEAYVELLRTGHVIVDIDERKEIILKQINELAEAKHWNIAIKEDLLEEVLFLVEYPTVLFGSFDPDFLNIPQEVLITSMREHQRYFPVLDEQGALLPHFVTVRNGNAVSLDQVARGNEKVLRARLQDARFFYQEDQKLPIDAALAKLETIVFHEELGTVGDRVRRIRKIADKLTGLLKVDGATAQYVQRAAAICKFDLVTQMVYEFPELQGIMGEDYAAKAGEAEPVARAVFEHYQPRFSGDAVPASLVGAIVSIADKIDTIAGCFAIGIIPTGSQDPYALRRQAAGIVQILLEQQLDCKLSDLFIIALDIQGKAGILKRSADEVSRDLASFFGLRVKNVLSDKVRYDVVDAVMASGFDDIKSVVGRAEALMESLEDANFKTTVESFNRVSNLAAKATALQVNTSIFADQAEHQLYQQWKEVHQNFAGQLTAHKNLEALQALTVLKEPITGFFDSVMVMAEDPTIKENRLALLLNIANDIRQFADFSKIVW